MDNLSTFFRQLFDYDYWANREALGSLAAVSGDAERARKIFSHIVGAQRLWMARFENPNPPAAEPWPTLTLDECRALVEELHRAWMQLLNKLTPEKLNGDLHYRNTKGLEFTTAIRDVLMQLVMHSAYHRGQVAMAVRDAGAKPAPTDYVAYVRQKSN